MEPYALDADRIDVLYSTRHERCGRDVVAVTPQEAVDATRAWLEAEVIGLDLCPFAKAVHAAGRIRYVVSGASTPDALRAELEVELRLLQSLDPAQTDTTLLIHPGVLENFLDFNDFLSTADAAVEDLGFTGVFQIASFHPRYRFAGVPEDDPANGTNRSPYPTLQILREASVERGLAAHPDPEGIPQRNIELLRRRATSPPPA